MPGSLEELLQTPLERHRAGPAAAAAQPVAGPAPWFRKLRAFERQAYLAHLLSLDGEGRRRRFQGAVTDAGIVAHVRRLDFTRVVIVGCFLEGRLVGVGEVALLDPARPAEAEIAVSVEPAHQGRGLGAQLTRRALRIARNRGAGTVWLYCLPENAPMRAIARRLQGQLRMHDGQVDARLQLLAPTLLTRLEERVEDSVGLLHSLTSLVSAPTA